jgi:hypothetical protein
MSLLFFFSFWMLVGGLSEMSSNVVEKLLHELVREVEVEVGRTTQEAKDFECHGSKQKKHEHQ